MSRNQTTWYVLFGLLIGVLAPTNVIAQDSSTAEGDALLESLFGTPSPPKDSTEENNAEENNAEENNADTDDGSSKTTSPSVVSDPFGGAFPIPDFDASADGFNELFGDDSSLHSVHRRDGKRIEPLSDYQAAIKLSQLQQRPILALLGARWCSWCRKMESDLETDKADSILKRWIVVTIDVDDEPKLAQELKAYALPSLRILGLDQSAIASREGYLPLKELEEWLDENLAEADPTIQRILYDSGSLDNKSLERLVSFLGHRAPDLRAAAETRLRNAKTDAAGTVVDTLRSGSLSQQLCAIDILHSWHAPIQELDPWQPESINEQSLAGLLAWSRNLDSKRDFNPLDIALDEENDEKKRNTHGGEELLDPEFLDQVLNDLLAADSASRLAQLASATSLGDQLEPSIRLRLASSDQLADPQRETLRELLYRVLVGPRTRLEKMTLLTALASLNAETHRNAAAQILKSATSQDQPLVDELSQDADALIREIAIGRLESIGALKNPDRIERLLRDPSPSVRTAVLRQLAEHPRDKSIAVLVDYLRRESDEDLLVYATKTLGQLGTKGGAAKALVELTQNTSWRVRAAAIDALGEAISSSNSQRVSFSFNSSTRRNNVSQETAEAVLHASKDSDPFVAEKAQKLIPEVISKKSAAVVAEFLSADLQRLDEIDKDVEEYERESMFQPLVKQAETWLEEGKVNRVRGAASILAKLAPTRLRARVAELLDSDDQATRIAAMKALLASLKELRNEQLDSRLTVWRRNQPRKTPVTDAWHAVPDIFRENTAEGATDSGAEKTLADSDAQTDSNANDDQFDLLDSFFGGQPASDAIAMTDPAESDDDARTVQDTTSSTDDSLDLAFSLFGDAPAADTESETPATQPPKEKKYAKALASEWLAEWQEEKERTGSARWVNECRGVLESRLGAFATLEPDAQSNDADKAELAWIHVALLACGNGELASTVCDAIVSQTTSGQPVRADALPWLATEHRLELLSSAQIDWSSSKTSSTKQLLGAATEVDDLAIADFVFDGFSRQQLDDAAISGIRKLLTRSLFGNRADEYADRIDADQLAKSQEPFLSFVRKHQLPGQTAGLAWLRTKYETAESPVMRAALLAALACVDHRLATESSVGLVSAASLDSAVVRAGLVIALADDAKRSADRAVLWLSHELPEVQRAALRRLTSSSWEFASSAGASGVPVCYDYSDQTPGLSQVWREIPVEPLLAIADSDDKKTRAMAQIVLLAAGQEGLALEELVNEDDEAKSYMKIVAALVKAGRNDEQAVTFFRKSLKVIDEYDEPSTLYGLIRKLPGDEVQQLRAEMRKRYGSQLMNSGY